MRCKNAREIPPAPPRRPAVKPLATAL
jgi:hypothetical protein